MMGLSVAITQGARFLGLPTVAGPVFYLDWELDKPTFLRRLYAICRGMERRFCPRFAHGPAYETFMPLRWSRGRVSHAVGSICNEPLQTETTGAHG